MGGRNSKKLACADKDLYERKKLFGTRKLTCRPLPCDAADEPCDCDLEECGGRAIPLNSPHYGGDYCNCDGNAADMKVPLNNPLYQGSFCHCDETKPTQSHYYK
jgi:hypothetical protein